MLDSKTDLNIGEIDGATQANQEKGHRNSGITITNKNLISPKHKLEKETYEYIKYEITEKNDENQCYVCIYEIPPEKAAYPYHYHLKNEEVFYIISGKGMLETPDGDREISAGDVIVCRPQESGAHQIRNTSSTENLVYLDCDTIHSPDVAYYPKSGKVGIIINGQPGTFYKTDNKVDYYDGEAEK